jgi:hypothetical protein
MSNELITKETALQASPVPSGEPSQKKGKKGQEKEQKQKKGECFYCHKLGHFKSECKTRLREQAEKGGQPSTGPLAQLGGRKGFSPPWHEEAQYSSIYDQEGASWVEVIEKDSGDAPTLVTANCVGGQNSTNALNARGDMS